MQFFVFDFKKMTNKTLEEKESPRQEKDQDKEIDFSSQVDAVLEKAINSSTKKKEKKSSQKGPEKKKPQNAMGELLEKNPIQTLKEGEKIEGRVLEVDSNAVYVDLGQFGTGVIYGKEIKDGLRTKKLEEGDEIVAVVLDLENDEGYVELSIREAMIEEAWKDILEKMANKEIIKTRILDANKGGLMVEINGITGFMPVSQLTSEHYPRVEDGDKNKILEILKTYVNTEMEMVIIDADQEENKLIVSEKEAFKDQEKKIVSKLKVGDIIEGEISGVVDFGAFVKFLPPYKKDSKDDSDKLEGLVHISQLAWQLIEDPREIVKVGDKVKAKIISIDDTRISLSLRDLQEDPWNKAQEKYKIGEVYPGRVHKVNHFGAFVYLDEDIHGLAHISGFGREFSGKSIDDIVKVGEVYNWKVMSLEPKEHRMGLKFEGEIAKEKKTKEKKAGKVKEEAKEAAKDTKEEAVSQDQKSKKGEEKESKETKKAKKEISDSAKTNQKKTASKKDASKEAKPEDQKSAKEAKPETKEKKK